MNRRKTFIIAILLLITCFILIVNHEKGSGQLDFNPPGNGIVPNEVAAIKIAEVIGGPIFGKNLNDYKPFRADLENDSVWHVYGLPKKPGPLFKLEDAQNLKSKKKMERF